MKNQLPSTIVLKPSFVCFFKGKKICCSTKKSKIRIRKIIIVIRNSLARRKKNSTQNVYTAAGGGAGAAAAAAAHDYDFCCLASLLADGFRFGFVLILEKYDIDVTFLLFA